MGNPRHPGGGYLQTWRNQGDNKSEQFLQRSSPLHREVLGPCIGTTIQPRRLRSHSEDFSTVCSEIHEQFEGRGPQVLKPWRQNDELVSLLTDSHLIGLDSHRLRQDVFIADIEICLSVGQGLGKLRRCPPQREDTALGARESGPHIGQRIVRGLAT